MLEVKNISKSYQNKIILDKISFQLTQNKILSILGKSGSGKTTLLKVLAGLETPDQGQVLVDNQIMNKVPAHQRKIVYLYQESLLFPHLNVFDNVAFGLRLQKHRGKSQKEAIQQKTEGLLEALGLANEAHKMPYEISGGQKQRVSFGRALIIKPRLLLLDEPFGNLDPDTRQQMQQLLKSMIAQYQITGLFVTHDIKEALLMGNQVALMQQGCLHTFSSMEEFIANKQTGAQAEMEFWKNLQG
ncbi:ABC transporter ATP-binding protein [Microscilla marina]|uniref:Sulfate/thiosulfate import ATP-binding protein CysA n=1 Tax=Microscilla marina ATCC 23134 TaxID=313606 RepID=A1ZTA7_MICM2|nr:ABC transporter ATP-binding protein [Microscilla marina]EAY26329.1 sulfate/thiosulfate import ATP-binding protein CysA [Microscilla marina ATCC 23134]